MKAMGQRDDIHMLKGTIEFDDAFFGCPTVGKKRGRGTEKGMVFIALFLTDDGRPLFLKMKPMDDIKQVSVRRLVQPSIVKESIILSNGYRSYGPALTEFEHKPKVYAPKDEMLHWLHVMISNARRFWGGTYRGLPQKNILATVLTSSVSALAAAAMVPACSTDWPWLLLLLRWDA